MRVSWAMGALLASVFAGRTQQYVISTVAGGGVPPTPVPAVSGAVGRVNRVVAAGGNFYFSSSLNCVFKVDAAGLMTRVAGNCRAGYAGDGGPATNAQLSDPEGLAVDHADNLYIADGNNNMIRKVSTDGIITSIAGNGQYDYAGDGGAAISASLAHPVGLAIDPSGNLYVADADNNCIRKISTAGIITTVAGVSGGPYVDGDYYGDGGPAIAAWLNDPEGVAIDHSGNLYIADRANARIRRVSTTGIIDTVAGTGNEGVSGDGTPATGAQLQAPMDIAVDLAGNLYIPDWGSPLTRHYENIRKVSVTGIISTIAGTGGGMGSYVGGYRGDGGPSVNALVNQPSGVTTDAAGNLYIADTLNGRVREITLDGNINTVAGGAAPTLGDGGLATSAELSNPAGLGAMAPGEFYIADANRVRKVLTGGSITTVAGNGTASGACESGPATGLGLNMVQSVAVDAAGNFYFTDMVDETLCTREVTPGGAMTLPLTIDDVIAWGGGLPTAFRVWYVAADPSGNLYLADNANGVIRKRTTAGVWSVIAGGGTEVTGEGGPATLVQLSLVRGLAADAAGNVYFVDPAYHRVRKISPEGIVTTVAGKLTSLYGHFVGGFSGDGGPATDAQLNSPQAVAVDSAGNLYIADTGNLRIRKVSKAGTITTIAGNGLSTYLGEGVAATSASFENPLAVAVDSAGNVYVADDVSDAVRKLTPATTPLPALSVSLMHSGDFTQGQHGATFSLQVSNASDGGSTNGSVVVTEYLPSAFSLVSMAGYGWTCTVNNCSRNDTLPAGGSYPGITVTVNIASDAARLQLNEVTATGGGSGRAVGADWTQVLPATAKTTIATYPPGLTVTVDGTAITTPQTFPWAPGTQHTISAPSPETVGGLPYVFTGWSDGGAQTHTVTAPYQAMTFAASFSRYIISTAAGGGPPVTSVQATASAIAGVTGVATDKLGNFYFSTTQHCVFKVDTSGILTRVAGVCRAGFSGDGGLATSAFLNFPGPLAVDTTGNLYIADVENARVRKVTPAGIVTTFAGTGIAGYTGDGGPAAAAQLNYVQGLATDSQGNLYIADASEQVVRKVTPGGAISTFAGNGAAGYSGDGGQAANATLGDNGPLGLAVDSADNLYIVDSGNNAIRKITPSGVITTAVGNPGDPTLSPLYFPGSAAVDNAGNLYVSELLKCVVLRITPGGEHSVWAGDPTKFGYGGDGQPGTQALLNSPEAVAIDPAGNLYIADFDNDRVRKVAPNGIITTAAGNGECCFSGDGGPATNAQVFAPGGIAADSSHNLYIADTGNLRVRMVSPTGAITTVAGTGECCYYGEGVQATAARFSSVDGIAKDSSGNIYVSEGFGHRIRKISPQGIISTLAGTGSPGYSGDGAPAASAQLNTPLGIAVDAQGNLYIADLENNRVRRISTTGTITTVAGTGIPSYSGDSGSATEATLNAPTDVAVDASGNLYIADAGNYRVRRVSAGVITTVAGNGLRGDTGDGGLATNAEVSPTGIAVDAAGNLLISEGQSWVVRQVSSNGIITPIAGNGVFGYTGDGGPATAAQLMHPGALAADPSGNIFIADASGDVAAIRQLQPIVGGAGPVLAITKSHIGNFTQGQKGASYTVAVGNTGLGPTSSAVTVTETAPSGLTLVSMDGGSAWDCSKLPACTTSSVINGGASFPAITVTVDVLGDAASPQVNTATVAGGGAATVSTTDSAVIGAAIGRCDINADRALDIADVLLVVKEALGVLSPTHDLNADSAVNVLEIQMEINAALKLGCAAK